MEAISCDEENAAIRFELCNTYHHIVDSSKDIYPCGYPQVISFASQVESLLFIWNVVNNKNSYSL